MRQTEAAGAPVRFETHGAYADATAGYHFVEYGWDHALSDIINALIGAGLRINHVHELLYVAGKRFPCMEQDEDGWRLKGHDGSIPLLFSLRATK